MTFLIFDYAIIKHLNWQNANMSSCDSNKNEVRYNLVWIDRHEVICHVQRHLCLNSLAVAASLLFFPPLLLLLCLIHHLNITPVLSVLLLLLLPCFTVHWVKSLEQLGLTASLSNFVTVIVDEREGFRFPEKLSRCSDSAVEQLASPLHLSGTGLHKSPQYGWYSHYPSQTRPQFDASFRFCAAALVVCKQMCGNNTCIVYMQRKWWHWLTGGIFSTHSMPDPLTRRHTFLVPISQCEDVHFSAVCT